MIVLHNSPFCADQLEYLRVLVDAVDENDGLPQVGSPFRYDGEELKRSFSMASALGQHTAATRAEFSHQNHNLF